MKTAASSAPSSPPLSRPLRRALISVSDKNGLASFAAALRDAGVDILSTGGTAKALQQAGINVTDVSAWTGFPEIMDGRVKTLHPKIHGGILARRDDPAHVNAQEMHGLGDIDLVVVNLYPFAETVARGAGTAECIENIDIGGPSLIRAAAKNHDFVTILTDPADYAAVVADMTRHDGATSLSLRRRLAAKAFALTAHYDAQIAAWFAAQQEALETVRQFPSLLTIPVTLRQTLRYGENPHQAAALYSSGAGRPGVASATQLQGKELSYNNLNDTDAAFELVAEFDAPAVAIIKHANPCGVAVAATPLDAYRNALRCDPVSAFGGIIALNRPLDAATAGAIAALFCEVIIAPAVEPAALDILRKKENLRVLATGGMPAPDQRRLSVRTLAGGLLVQDTDEARITPENLRTVTDRPPTAQELRDLLFAFAVAKHVKSNAIVYAKDGATAGIGAGQMSRIDSTRIAAWKAREAAEQAKLPQPLTHGSVVASDAFFPFADGLIAAAEAGATAIIQPGGSIRDGDVIAAANERGLAMVFTGLRHFRH